jgi:hypothetical protein
MHKHSPSWYLLSLEATVDIGYDALVPAVVFTALALCMVLGRWYSRVCCMPRNVGWEDWCVSVAMVRFIFEFGMGLTQV